MLLFITRVKACRVNWNAHTTSDECQQPAVVTKGRNFKNKTFPEKIYSKNIERNKNNWFYLFSKCFEPSKNSQICFKENFKTIKWKDCRAFSLVEFICFFYEKKYSASIISHIFVNFINSMPSIYTSQISRVFCDAVYFDRWFGVFDMRFCEVISSSPRYQLWVQSQQL